MIRGAVALAKNVGLSKAVIGLTVVAYGTSAPELVVSLESALTGHAAIAIGNVTGSNITNTLLILGLTALIYPLVADKNLLKPDGLTLFAVTLLIVMFSWDGVIQWWEGLIYVIIGVAYNWAVFRKGKEDGYAELEAEMGDELAVEMPTWKSVAYVVAGLIMLVAGAEFMIDSGVALAERIGVSEGVIGATIIALGTSLPELAASLAAARKGHADIAVANVLGSNLMNLFGIIGVTALITPLPVAPQFMHFDLWLLLGVTMLFVGMLAAGIRIGRILGVLFTLGFIGYIAVEYQVLLT